MPDFPKDFLWGASTAAYQIEGGNDRSALWDWEIRQGWERSGEAARSWELFEEDLKLIKALNLGAYRFSIEWSRVEPEPGRFDEKALERYAAWTRRLKEEGIRPFVCFHHFSEPAWLLKLHPRGWLDDSVRARFLSFVRKAAPALAAHANDWVTFNEPMVFLTGAYGFRFLPPGRWMLTNVEREFRPRLVPNLARAHNEAFEYLHELQSGARVGVAHNLYALEPARPGDGEAVAVWDRFMHRDFLDLTRGRHDYLGINYYSRIFVAKSPVPFAPAGVVPGYAELEQRLSRPLFRLVGGRRDGKPRSAMDWEIVPEAFGPLLHRFSKDYGLPIYVLENGMAEPSQITREQFLRDHLASLSAAIKAGGDIRGYFHWSLLDNYEWGSYRPRFGLYTRDRKPANGAEYYARVAKTGELA